MATSIGLATFFEPIQTQDLTFDVGLLSRTNWDISIKKNANYLPPSILQKIKQAQIENFHGRQNQNPKMLKIICHISFPKLTYLTIRNNDIQSIEQIYVLNCPLLTHLYLGNNLITTFKAIRKTQFKNLKELSIHNNPTPQFPHFKDSNYPLLSSLWLEDNPSDSLIGENILILVAAWQLRGIVHFHKNASERIKNKRLESMFDEMIPKQ